MESRPSAILFVDVCGSTAYFDRHGEIAGREMVERCLGIVVPEIELRRGRIVKKMGDGLLAVFDGAAAMIRAASAAHTNLATANEAWTSDKRIRIHSGGHVGAIVVDELGDVFGDAVNVAARVQGIAGPDQIFVTRDVIEGIGPDDPPFESRRIGAFPLRGKNEDVELHEVLWRTESSTMLVSHAVLRELAAAAKLRLRSFDRTFEFPPGRDRVTIGRIEGNDFVVADAAVSREHADIVRRKGFFYLVDRSTNGTYARPASGMPRHVHRDEFLLEGTGSFSLGRPDGPPVEYEVG